MALRNILYEGDSTLLKKSRIVTECNSRICTLIDDMRDTLLESGGVGLAAPQVGVLRRVVLVMDTNKEELTPEEQIIELINPVILETSGAQEGPEGCLSLPGKFGIVTRPETVTVRAFDRHGKQFEATGTKLTARAFCHEIDHLDGHLFTEFAMRMMTDDELETISGEDDEE